MSHDFNLRGLFASFFALFLIFAPVRLAGQESALETIEIRSASGVHKVSVEVMRTPEQLERGLMFRKYMPEDRGMLFDFKSEAPIMMWMKNTYIPLDMVFISKDGTITGIAENAEPLSESIIPSNGPILSVLEINAGVSAKLGLKKGDKIIASIFPQ